MFSGIVEELGQVRKISRSQAGAHFEIKAREVPQDTQVGGSVSVNGACLTVTKKEAGVLHFEVMPQTLKVTNLGLLKAQDKVNLERSLKVGDRLGGHFVSGHVDSMGIIRRKHFVQGNLAFEISIPPQFIRYCLSKGCVAVNGISLTMAEIKSNTFSVYIIPHTLKTTTLGFKGPSDKVNIEFDVLAKANRC
jgi:riboflavin synthase